VFQGDPEGSPSGFVADIPGYSVRRLQPEDTQVLQKLFEKCSDYMMIVEGEGVSPTAAEEIFVSAPPGRSLEDKFLFGLVDPTGELVGVLEGFRHYPQAAIWWIGLLLLAPEVRGRGVGGEVLRAFAEWVRSQGGSAIMLGVVEDNQRAYRFWQQAGFELVRKTEPRPFGKKTQVVLVMRRTLPG
jgi:GNAT superfamily N-acetyltransferase